MNCSTPPPPPLSADFEIALQDPLIARMDIPDNLRMLSLYAAVMSMLGEDDQGRPMHPMSQQTVLGLNAGLVLPFLAKSLKGVGGQNPTFWKSYEVGEPDPYQRFLEKFSLSTRYQPISRSGAPERYEGVDKDTFGHHNFVVGIPRQVPISSPVKINLAHCYQSKGSPLDYLGLGTLHRLLDKQRRREKPVTLVLSIADFFSESNEQAQTTLSEIFRRFGYNIEPVLERVMVPHDPKFSFLRELKQLEKKNKQGMSSEIMQQLAAFGIDKLGEFRFYQDQEGIEPTISAAVAQQRKSNGDPVFSQTQVYMAVPARTL